MFCKLMIIVVFFGMRYLFNTSLAMVRLVIIGMIEYSLSDFLSVEML